MGILQLVVDQTRNKIILFQTKFYLKLNYVVYILLNDDACYGDVHGG